MFMLVDVLGEDYSLTALHHRMCLRSFKTAAVSIRRFIQTHTLESFDSIHRGLGITFIYRAHVLTMKCKIRIQ